MRRRLASERIDQALGSRWTLVAIAALALVLRLGHTMAMSDMEFFDELQLDHRYYDEWAQRITEGELVGSSAFFVDPLYAYVLGAFYWIFGHTLTGVRVAQAALGVATCVLAARLGQRVTGSAARGNLAGLLVAAFIPSAFYDGMIEKTTLAVFLFVVALLFFVGTTRRQALLAGLFMGLATLARGNFLALVPLGVVALWIMRPATENGAANTDPVWKRWLRSRSALFALGATAMIGLATAHNVAASGEVVLTTINMGQNLYIAHHEGNDSGTYRAPDFVRPDPRYEEDDFRKEAERLEGRELSAKEVSSYWFGEGLDAFFADLGVTTKQTFKKLYLFWHAREIPDNGHIGVVANYSPVLTIPFVWLGFLFAFGLLGAIVSWRQGGHMRLLTLTAVVYCAAVVGFFVVARFRVQIVPVVAILAAEGICWLRGAAITVPARRLVFGWGSALVLIAWLGATWEPDWMHKERESSLAIGNHNLGNQFLAAGREDEGIAAMERAVALKPTAVVASLRRLGDLYAKRGEYELAEKHMLKVLEIKPNSGMGRRALARLYAQMARDPGHQSDAALQTKLEAARKAAGVARSANSTPTATPANRARANQLYANIKALRGEGRFTEAIAALKEAIRIGRYNENARYLLGSLLSKHAPPAEMVAYYSEAVATDPKPQTSHYFWGMGLHLQGDADGAIEKLKKALDVDPAHEMSQVYWGRILQGRGQLEDALLHYREAATILPPFKEAHERAAAVLDELARPREAQEHRAKALHPSTTQNTVHWARYLLAKGRRTAAMREIRRALKAKPDDAEAKDLLAQAQALTPAQSRDAG